MTTPDLLQHAVGLLQSGRLDDVERLLTEALQATPGDPDALALLGLTRAQRNRNDSAAALMERSLKAKPNQPVTLINYAKVLTKLQRWPDVAAATTALLSITGGHNEARRLRGQAYTELGRSAEALAELDLVTTVNVASLLTRAKLRYAAGRPADAVTDYDRIVTLDPSNWEAYNNRGIALEALQKYEEALQSYDRAFALNPHDTLIQHNRAASLMTLRRSEEALPMFERLVAIEPGQIDNWTGHGAALASLQRLEDALVSFAKALTLDPNSVRVLVNRGATYAGLGRMDEAVADYRRAIALEPNNAAAHANLAFALLADGKLQEGFAEYEWRRQDGPIKRLGRAFETAEWNGEDLDGKTLLLHPEQGLGDIIQFARFVPILAARGAKIVLEVPPPLEQLMRTLAGGAKIVRAGEPLPPFDFHAPLMSLAHKLGTTLGTIPSTVPYLSATATNLARWQERLANLKRPRVGLCWSGNPALTNDRARSIPLSTFARIAATPGISFVNLQRDVRESDKEAFQALANVTDYMSGVADFADTAALIGELDLVVCVDTSVAHLAAALGKPVWILIATSSDWRWLRDRDDSPWYPTAHLYRQKRDGDWDEVLKRLCADLAAQ